MEKMMEELRERESRRLNLVIHGVPEPETGATNPRDRMEMDKGEIERRFGGMRVRTRKQQIRFCRRVGERARSRGPLSSGYTRRKKEGTFWRGPES